MRIGRPHSPQKRLTKAKKEKRIKQSIPKYRSSLLENIQCLRKILSLHINYIICWILSRIHIRTSGKSYLMVFNFHCFSLRKKKVLAGLRGRGASSYIWHFSHSESLVKDLRLWRQKKKTSCSGASTRKSFQFSETVLKK